MAGLRLRTSPATLDGLKMEKVHRRARGAFHEDQLNVPVKTVIMIAKRAARARRSRDFGAIGKRPTGAVAHTGRCETIPNGKHLAGDEIKCRAGQIGQRHLLAVVPAGPKSKPSGQMLQFGQTRPWRCLW